MEDNSKLFELIKKEIVNLKEFQYIANHDFVSEIVFEKADSKHLGCSKYVVKYINADSDAIYLKR